MVLVRFNAATDRLRMRPFFSGAQSKPRHPQKIHPCSEMIICRKPQGTYVEQYSKIAQLNYVCATTLRHAIVLILDKTNRQPVALVACVLVHNTTCIKATAACAKTTALSSRPKISIGTNMEKTTTVMVT